jgi:hypothetical protein
VLFSQVCADNNEKYNGKYLNKMFSKGYFNSKDIAKGTPIKIQNKKFLDQKYKCQIINYSFKIDALGKIYPCCFLFDDNQGENSTIRDKYELYNLRRNGKVAYNPSNSKEILMNILREIDTYKTNDIPINEEACSYCTRHFYQNQFLNKLDKIAKEYDDIKYVPKFSEEDKSMIWI